MSVKHVKEYYNQLFKDFHEMTTMLREMEDECQKNLISEEQLENIKKTIEPIKTNFERIQYIMFLLDQPNKKEKVARYKKRNEALLKNSVSLDELKKENKEALDKLKNI